MEKEEKKTAIDEIKLLGIDILIKPDKKPNEVIKVINAVEKLMKENANALTYTQMRNIYGIIQKTNDFIELHRARPRIAYIQARQDGNGKKLVGFFADIMKLVEDVNQFNEFKQLMESVVAYHKLYEKKKN